MNIIKTAIGMFLWQTGRLFYPPMRRAGEQIMDRLDPNVLLSPSNLVSLKQRNKISDKYAKWSMAGQGINAERAGLLLSLSKRLLQVEELMSLRRRKVISSEEYTARIGELGVSEKDGEKLYSLSETPLDVPTVISAMWRNIAFREGKPALRKELERQGFTPDRISVIEEVSKFYPSARDLVFWQAKEVFEPDAVKKYGLKDELELLDREAFYKAGMTDEQIENFWMAHWEHPSWLRVREMLHRTDLNEEDVYEWFRLVEIPPYWREKFTAIMYSPYTRVDVRRMHKLGVLNREEVKKAYQELGYDENKSEHLTEFTILYNEDTPDTEKTAEEKRRDELRGLTRSAIIKRYKGGWITGAEALEYLKGLMLTPEVAEYYISMADYDREEERVDSYIAIFHRMFVNGIWDYNTTIDWMGKLNLPAKNIEYMVGLWDIERVSKASQPSKSELKKLVDAKIITLDTWQKKMADLGYNETYVSWYQKLYDLTPA